jgi:hypothetical protein
MIFQTHARGLGAPLDFGGASVGQVLPVDSFSVFPGLEPMPSDPLPFIGLMNPNIIPPPSDPLPFIGLMNPNIIPPPSEPRLYIARPISVEDMISPREVGWPPPEPEPEPEPRLYIALPAPREPEPLLYDGGPTDVALPFRWDEPEPLLYDGGPTDVALPFRWDEPISQKPISAAQPAEPTVSAPASASVPSAEQPGPLGLPWAGWIVAAGAALKFVL